MPVASDATYCRPEGQILLNIFRPLQPEGANTMGKRPFVLFLVIFITLSGIPLNLSVAKKVDEIPMRVEAKKVIYGCYPYWTDDTYEPPWSLLTHLCWHSVGINSDGSIYNPNNWPSSAPVERAHNNGVNFTLSVTNFNSDSLDELLANNREYAAANLLSTVKEGAADGLALDFEGIREINTITATPNKDLLKEFLEEVYTVFKDDNSSYIVSLWLPPFDWQHVYTHPDIRDFADSFLHMGYNYHNKGSGSTGPVGPLSDPDGTDIESALNSTSHGYTRFIPREKIVLIASWYGIKWPASGSEKGAQTQGTGTSMFMRNAIPEANNFESLWDEASGTPWYRYKEGEQWYQCWYENARSFKGKAEYVRNNGFQGLGMWALGYEGNRRDVWDVVEEEIWQIYSVKVVIDPEGGYYRDEPGSRWEWQSGEHYGLREDINNILIARKLVDLLQGSDVEIYCTRELDEDGGIGESGFKRWKEGAYEYLKDRSGYSPAEALNVMDDERIRAYYANEIGGDVLISIGSLASANGNGIERGFLTVYGSVAVSDDADIYDKDLAEAIHSELSSILSDDLPDRGAMKDTDIFQHPLYLLSISEMPSAVIEVGYFDNATDAGLLMDGNFRHKAAVGIFKGLANYLRFPVDNSAPRIDVIAPDNGQILIEIGGITGTVYDEGEILAVEVRISRNSDSAYWNGTSWSNYELWLGCEILNGTSWSYTILKALGEGVFTVSARALDILYNVGEAPFLTVTIDITPPQIGIMDPMDDETLEELQAVRGNISDVHPIERVEIIIRNETTGSYHGGDGWLHSEIWLGATLSDDRSWEYVIPFSFADGSYSIVARGRDAAGNIGQSGPITFEIRSLAPFITVNHPSHGDIYTECPSFSGSVDSEISVREVSLAIKRTYEEMYFGPGGNWSPDEKWFEVTMITERMWEFQLSRPLTDGLYLVVIRIKDSSGNIFYSHDVGFSIDSIPPDLDIIDPVDGSSVGNLDNISGTVYDQSPLALLEMKVQRVIQGTFWNGKDWSSEETWLTVRYTTDGNWSHGCEGVFEPGKYSVTIRAADIAGNGYTGKLITFDVPLSVRGILSFSPANDELNVPVETDIVVIFANSMDHVSVEKNLSFIPEIDMDISWSENYTGMAISPKGRLSYETEYFLIIFKDAADITGEILGESFFLRFITANYEGMDAILMGAVISRDNIPVTNATVELRGPMRMSCSTDENGLFSFDLLMVGDGYELIISKEGVGVGRWKFDLGEGEVKDMGNLYLGKEKDDEKKGDGGIGSTLLLITGIILIIIVVLVGGFAVRSKGKGKRELENSINEEKMPGEPKGEGSQID